MIAITMGDGNGVGPEIILKTFTEYHLDDYFVVIGDISCMEFCSEQLSISIPFHVIHSIKEAKAGVLNVWDLGLLRLLRIKP